MKNNVYYGEYSLMHWINLILNKNIVLPKYQRAFVWDKDAAHDLLITFKENHFVPPVTIGSFNRDNKNENLIIDGQQRLTCIFLAYLKIFPRSDFFEKIDTSNAFINDNDNDNDDEDEYEFIDWKFNRLLTSKNNDRASILQEIQEAQYTDFALEISEDFFEKNFLGFNYLVPHSTQNNQKYYSTVFRNINVGGTNLIPQESRAALYFLDESLQSFFDPDEAKLITVTVSHSKKNRAPKMDFVRYLSLLSQYHKDPSKVHYIARGFKSKIENYYYNYIDLVIKDNDSKLFAQFSSIFSKKEVWRNRLENLWKIRKQLNLVNSYPSIIDLDMHFFGLVYVVLFLDKNFTIDNPEDFKKKLNEEIDKLKENSRHTRSPNNLGFLRERIQKSIELFMGEIDDAS